MTCRQTVEQMDLGEPPASFRAWLRLKLHLSLCKACRYYFQASRILGAAIRQMVDGSGAVDVEKINHELLQKFTREGSRE